MNDNSVVLLLETEAIARHALGEYLRACGYRVVEASNTDEALAYLRGSETVIDVALLDAQASGGEDVFALARSIRSQFSADVIMVGAVEAAARKAAELCESGPTLARPYDHSLVVDLIRRLRAARDRD